MDLLLNENNVENLNIKLVSPEDAEDLLQIYAPYIEHTAITFEYVVPDVQEFRQRIINVLTKYPWIAAEKNGEIVGYAYAGMFKERAAYAWSVETSIYVKMNQKRKGIGKKLYSALETLLAMQNIQNLNACIVYTEVEDEYLTMDSIRFHEKGGYHLVGKFSKCGYKFGRWYDMAWMEKHIGSHENQPEPVKYFPQLRNEIISELRELSEINKK